ncbi:MAG: ABC transporter permease [Blastocatellia bacterium]|nr:ABC transporter permease [Blastocatellia bacterium]
MIKHLIKMVWNRKRVNFLMTLEIFISFLVLFAVILFAVYYTDNYRQPLGFEYRNVWNVSIDRSGIDNKGETVGPEIPPSHLLSNVRDFDEVEDAAGVSLAPYSLSNSNSVIEHNGRTIWYGFNRVTDSFKDVMGLTIVAGKWFGPEDDGANWQPVVINQRLARDMFGSEDPVGKNFPTGNDTDITRVIGVITDFRQDGEYAGLDNYLFFRNDINGAEASPLQNIVVHVRPGTTAAFEEKLIERLQATARDWTFDIEPLTSMREQVSQIRLIPLIAAGVVAGFLMIMVALGLVGVLWLNVTQRTKEIGLRRAKGATARKIHTQILGELVVIASFGLMLGIIVVVQIPILDVISFISARVYAYSLSISVLLIYILTLLCGLYPSRLATRVQPAEALHYE